MFQSLKSSHSILHPVCQTHRVKNSDTVRMWAMGDTQRWTPCICHLWSAKSPAWTTCGQWRRPINTQINQSHPSFMGKRGWGETLQQVSSINPFRPTKTYSYLFSMPAVLTWTTLISSALNFAFTLVPNTVTCYMLLERLTILVQTMSTKRNGSVRFYILPSCRSRLKSCGT